MSRIQEATTTRGHAPSHSPPDMHFVPGVKLARKLGWISIGLGAAELLFPKLMRRATGIENETLLAAYGLREIACGVAILTSSQPAPWLWARVAGDVMDLATLAHVMATGNHEQCQAAMIASAAVAGVAAADLMCGAEMTAGMALEG